MIFITIEALEMLLNNIQNSNKPEFKKVEPVFMVISVKKPPVFKCKRYFVIPKIVFK